MATEIERRILLGVESKAIGGIGVTYRIAAMNFDTTEFVVDTSVMRKEAGRRKKDVPNSINRAVIRPTMVHGTLTLQVVTASLILSREGLDAPSLTNESASQSLALPFDEWTGDPNEVAISRIVGRFKSAAGDIRRAASLAAQTADKKAWAQLRDEAHIKLFQVDMLMPVKKVIVAFGFGKEIFQHALTGPEAHSKRLGKDGLARDVLLHRMWRHALTTQCAVPPLIKL